jgi:hypothetical protein
MNTQEAIETIKTAIAEVEWNYPMDYAVAFEMAIEALGQRNQWVSAKDRLPDDSESGCNFICFTNATGKSNGVIPMEYEVTTIRGKTIRRWRWYDRISPWEVTHWMPLPEPPKQEKD